MNGYVVETLLVFKKSRIHPATMQTGAGPVPHAAGDEHVRDHFQESGGSEQSADFAGRGGHFSGAVHVVIGVMHGAQADSLVMAHSGPGAFEAGSW